MYGMDWATAEQVRDFLRTNPDNDGVISSIMGGLAQEIEIATGVPADVVTSTECPELVKQLVLFMLLQRFDIEMTNVDRVVDSLMKSVQMMQLGQ